MVRTGLKGSASIVVSALLLSACSDGSGTNADRANAFTSIASSANFSAPSDLAGLQGSATFRGAALADFGDFGGTSDATIVADFSSRQVSGRMTGWEDRDPVNFELDGSVLVSNGQIAADGTFTAQLAGNVERTRRGPDLPGESPVLVVFSGDATGAFYDGTSGQRANVVRGEFSGTSVDGADVTGQFIANR